MSITCEAGLPDADIAYVVHFIPSALIGPNSHRGQRRAQEIVAVTRRTEGDIIEK